VVRGCSAPAGTRAFLELQGNNTQGVVLMGSNLLAAGQAVNSGPGVPKDAVTVAGNVMKA
jgi:hypothetical protein